MPIPKAVQQEFERQLHMYEGELRTGLDKHFGLSSVRAGGPGSSRYPKGSGQQHEAKGRAPAGRIFVSPNVEEGTKLDQALTALKSDRQKNFEGKAQEVATAVLHDKTDVHPAVGVWADGAENSSEIRADTADAERQQYLSALMGKAANQKAVLNWRRDANGGHTLYAMQSGDTLDTLNSKFEKAGIEFRTIEASADGKSSTAYVLDQDGSLAEKIGKFGDDNGYETTAEKGNGDFIGSWNTREEGLTAYNKVISSYEQAHPENAYKGHLRFAGRIRSGADAGGIPNGSGWPDIYRYGRISAAYQENLVQSAIAKRMPAGVFRVWAKGGCLVVTHNLERARLLAANKASRDLLVQVYDSSGTVVFAAGGGFPVT